jgi:hypothetical protein
MKPRRSQKPSSQASPNKRWEPMHWILLWQILMNAAPAVMKELKYLIIAILLLVYGSSSLPVLPLFSRLLIQDIAAQAP